jgi:hypothetical protein
MMIDAPHCTALRCAHLICMSVSSTAGSVVNTGFCVASAAMVMSTTPTVAAVDRSTSASLAADVGARTRKRGISALAAVNMGSVQKESRK